MDRILLVYRIANRVENFMSLEGNRGFVVAAIASVSIIIALALHTTDVESSEALSDFFAALDDNHDGQVDEAEAKKYIGESIGGQEYDSAVELTEAFQHMVTNIDKAEGEERKMISVAEVEEHLQNLQHAVSVKEWVRHGLGLSQYAETFKENVITAADFPLLVNDGGNVLEEELHISSRLHRNQIMRGMKRLMLGLGELPSVPNVISCQASSETHWMLHWAAPVRMGDPPVHKYLIESLDLDRSGASWVTVAEIDAHLSRQEYSDVVDVAPGRHRFRVVAWTAYGPSQYAVFDACRSLLDQPLETEERSSHADYMNFLLGTQKQTPMIASVPRSVEVEAHASDVRTQGIWTVLVIGVMIALRTLNSRHALFLKCCFLYRLERIASLMRLQSSAQYLREIQRTECPRCKALHEATETKDTIKHRALSERKVAKSQKLPPTQHFETSKGSFEHSVSSPALGDPHIQYRLTEWDLSKSTEDNENTPQPEYSTTGWEEKEAPPASTSSPSSGPVVATTWNDGRCAYDGCKREVNGFLLLRNRKASHFCSNCLRMYCHQHTRIAVHGAWTSCGHDSSCVCVNCFLTLPKSRQDELEAINKLHKPRE